uniref:Regulatory protein zeste n=1 Tax=Cacopsylla melanoneura TaxID=428564 RepID=A0A8D8SNL3_9HEMI
MTHSRQEKLLVLRKIEDHKVVLFGKFDNHLTRQDKKKTWKEIFLSCQALGLFRGKEFTYLRDTFFPNLRKCTMVSLCVAGVVGNFEFINGLYGWILNLVRKMRSRSYEGSAKKHRLRTPHLRRHQLIQDNQRQYQIRNHSQRSRERNKTNVP